MRWIEAATACIPSGMTKVTHLTLDEGGGLNRKRIHLREISGEADAPLETIGQDLRAARLRRGDDLATASKALKIRKDHLEALEEDRLDSLPGRTYAIGFVRSYSEYLGLDAVEAVERFKAEIAGRDEAPKQPVFQESDDGRRLPHGWVIIAIVVLGLVFYGAYRLARSANTLLNEPVAPVPARMAPPAQKPILAPPQQTLLPGAATMATPADKGGPTDSNQAAAGQPAPQAAQQSAAANTEPPAESAASPPQGRAYGLRNHGSRVLLRALATTKVLVEGSTGTVFINRTLHRGDTYRVPDLVGLTLTTPNAGALQVELDGQMMGRAGRPKEIAEALSLDPQAIVDRSNDR